MKRVIVALLLLGACVREPAPIPAPGEACFEGADHCSVDDDCGLSARTLCRDAEIW